MTKQDFRNLINKEGIVYVDGATGSRLIQKGMPSGVCPELWILEHADILRELQEEYIAAGSHIVYSPTFTANRIKLAEYGINDGVEEMNRKLVAISREAVGDRGLVGGDISMTGKQLYPMGTLTFEELITVYKEQIEALQKAGVDLLVVETMMSLQEARAALIAAKEVCDLPVLVTMTFEKDGRTLYGTDAVTSAVVLESLGADAIGANCSSGPLQMVPIISAMAEAVGIPIIAKPNAGLPYINDDGKTAYDMLPEEFGEAMTELVKAGACILGGCCGTGPEYIASMKQKIDQMKPEERTAGESDRACSRRRLTSERKTFSFTLEDPFVIVGERINPTGKKAFQEAIRNRDYRMAVKFAEEQEENGAKILDINLGMSGIDEQEVFLKVMQEVMNVTNLPLSIDSSHAEVVEAALRLYPGRALVNSVSLESGRCERLLPVIKKYGAMFVLLPLSDAGLPQSKEEKIEIVRAIVKKAEAAGLNKEDIIIDGLVTTVGANPTAARETLELIEYCKQNGYATICGLSNVSFGLPERGLVNTTFLTMAIERGLTMAIANPMQTMLKNAVVTSDMLLNRVNAAAHYIESVITAEESKDAVKKTSESESASARLERDVIKGNRDDVLTAVQIAFEETQSADELLNEILLPAIAKVGKLFEQGRYYLPQLIGSAEAMKIAVEYLEPHLAHTAGDAVEATIVIATVKGDIHDIGKNLVALMLKNYGFRVIDLGKDVEAETIVTAAIREKASIIALSALMTTTMQEMRHVIEYSKRVGFQGKIMIGGAVITQEYADEIGADGYSRDAQEAVKVAKSLLA